MSDYTQLHGLTGIAQLADRAEVVELPPTEEEQAAAEQLEAMPGTAEMLKGVMMPTAQILAPNWAISAEEIDQLGDAYGALIDKYVPDGIGGRWAAEVTALTCTAMVVVPRLGTPRKLKPKKKTDNEVTDDKATH